jgi:DNA-binding SARP family transcriptional activator
LWFGILGPLQVRRNGSVVRIGSARERVLLAALLVRAHQTVTVDELVDRLWGRRPPVHPKAALHTLMTRLRQRLGEHGMIHTEPCGYSITPERLDLVQFHAGVQAADDAALRGDAVTEAEQLRTVLAMWRGPVLADVPSDSLHRQFVPVLVEERLATLQRRIAVDISLGRSDSLVAELRGLTAEHPLRERFWAQLMLALHHADRQAEALAAYDSVRGRLVEELGVEPGRELRRIHAHVLSMTFERPELRTA